MQIKPLHDWICVKNVEYKHPIFYVHGAATHKGIVVAVGPGKRIRKWLEVKDPVTGKPFRARVGAERNAREPMDIVPGDVIEYSNNGWEKREIDGTEYVFVRQGSVIGFTDLEDKQGFQGHVGAVIA